LIHVDQSFFARTIRFEAMDIVCLFECSPLVDQVKFARVAATIQFLMTLPNNYTYALIADEIHQITNSSDITKPFRTTNCCNLASVLGRFQFHNRTLVFLFVSGLPSWSNEEKEHFLQNTSKHVSFDVQYLNESHEDLDFIQRFNHREDCYLKLPFGLAAHCIQHDLARWHSKKIQSTSNSLGLLSHSPSAQESFLTGIGKRSIFSSLAQMCEQQPPLGFFVQLEILMYVPFTMSRHLRICGVSLTSTNNAHLVPFHSDSIYFRLYPCVMMRIHEPANLLHHLHLQAFLFELQSKEDGPLLRDLANVSILPVLRRRRDVKSILKTCGYHPALNKFINKFENVEELIALVYASRLSDDCEEVRLSSAFDRQSWERAVILEVIMRAEEICNTSVDILIPKLDLPVNPKCDLRQCINHEACKQICEQLKTSVTVAETLRIFHKTLEDILCPNLAENDQIYWIALCATQHEAPKCPEKILLEDINYLILKILRPHQDFALRRSISDLATSRMKLHGNRLSSPLQVTFLNYKRILTVLNAMFAVKELVPVQEQQMNRIFQLLQDRNSMLPFVEQKAIHEPFDCDRCNDEFDTQAIGNQCLTCGMPLAMNQQPAHALHQHLKRFTPFVMPHYFAATRRAFHECGQHPSIFAFLGRMKKHMRKQGCSVFFMYHFINHILPSRYWQLFVLHRASKPDPQEFLEEHTVPDDQRHWVYLLLGTSREIEAILLDRKFGDACQ
jgi:hypothetical protein